MSLALVFFLAFLAVFTVLVFALFGLRDADARHERDVNTNIRLAADLAAAERRAGMHAVPSSAQEWAAIEAAQRVIEVPEQRRPGRWS